MQASRIFQGLQDVTTLRRWNVLACFDATGDKIVCANVCGQCLALIGCLWPTSQASASFIGCYGQSLAGSSKEVAAAKVRSASVQREGVRRRSSDEAVIALQADVR